jgi:hypothetical protein
MSLSKGLQEVLTGFSLDQEIRLATHGWPSLDQLAVHRAKAHLEMQLDNLQTYASTMGGEESASELYEALAFWYMEARCEWAQVNLSANHQLWTSGLADQSLLIRGTVGSNLLTRVSRLLRPEDVDDLENGLMTTLNQILYPA